MKKTVAVIFGGRSAEHDVSIITAHTPIIQALQASGQFEVLPVYVSKEGAWYAEKAMLSLEYFKQPEWENQLTKIKKVRLLFDNGLIFNWNGIKQKNVKIDVVFTAMHGTYGEDGSLMGLLRMANVPFVGCDLFASAVAMDKALTKQVLVAENLPVVPFVWFMAADWQSKQEKISQQIAKLKYPLFVKPVHLGSSIAITKVKTSAELENAVEVALHYDDKVLVEEGVEDLIEVTLPIMGNNEIILAEIERPLNKTELFNFEDKYLSGGKKGGGVSNQYSELPAKIGQQLSDQVRQLGRETYRVLGCEGIARVDFLIDNKTQKVYVNEVNTLPGSLYHHNWRKSGVSGVELVTKLIALAEARFAAQKSKTHTFKSDILNNSGGAKS